MLRTYLEFSTSLPEEWNEAGDKCGANVVQAFAELLADQGLMIEPIEDAGDHGWDFVACGDRRLYFQVSPIDDILVIVSEYSNGLAFWKRRPPSIIASVLTELNDQLAADDRFSNVRWYFPKEYSHTSLGAPTPLSPVDGGQPSGRPGPGSLQLAWWLSIWLAVAATAIALTNLVNGLLHRPSTGWPWVLVPVGYLLAFAVWRYAIGLQRKGKRLSDSGTQPDHN